MTSESMVQRVARLLCAQRGVDPDHLEPGDAFGIDGYKRNGDPAHFVWREYAEKARVIIEAMREPTDDMAEVGWEVCAETIRTNKLYPDRETLSPPVEAWRAMIDAALAEEKQPA